MALLQNERKPSTWAPVRRGRHRGHRTGAGTHGAVPAVVAVGRAFRDGKLVFMMQRRDIETRDAVAIAYHLKAAFDAHCG